jgi:hypothetical protein
VIERGAAFIGGEASADDRRMGAWQLRAIVYGLLAVVSALVLWQSGALAGEPEPPRVLHGRTSQGASIALSVRDGDLTHFDVGPLPSRCANGGSWKVGRWYPGIPQGNVSYVRDGDSFVVHERPDPRYGDGGRARVNLYMRASFGEGGRIAGVIWYTAAPGGIRCESRPVAFSAGP